MIQAVILDDEIKGSTLLEHKLKPFSDKIIVEKVFNDPKIALEGIQNIRTDVLFLDIEMPGMNGFQFLEKLEQFDFEVIFVTAYGSHVLEALRSNALDYLLKPVNPEELEMALAKLEKRIQAKKEISHQNTSTGSSNQSRLSLATAEGVYFVKKEEIMKVEAMSNYSVFHIVSKPKIIVSKTLKDFENALSANNFVRVNRSVIVNLDYVVRYKKGDGGTLEMVDGSEVEVSSTKKHILLEKLLSI